MYLYFGHKWNSYWQDFALYTLPLSATEPPASLLALVRTQEAGDPHLNRSNKNNKSLERVSLGPHIHYAALQERRGLEPFRLLSCIARSRMFRRISCLETNFSFCLQLLVTLFFLMTCPWARTSTMPARGARPRTFLANVSFVYRDQCCGSEMFIPDPNFFHTGSRVKKIPGSASASKNLSILTQKWFLSSRK